MDGPRILVVAETPSLGRAISELLSVRGLEHRCVIDAAALGPLWSLSERYPLLVVACNAPYCVTGRRLARGELPGARLLVVGSRDPVLQGLDGVSVLPLPIDANRLLQEIDRQRAAFGEPSGSPPAG